MRGDPPVEPAVNPYPSGMGAALDVLIHELLIESCDRVYLKRLVDESVKRQVDALVKSEVLANKRGWFHKGMEAILREKIADLIAGNKLVPMVDDLAKKAWDKIKTDFSEPRMAQLVSEVIRSTFYSMGSNHIETLLKEEIRSRLDGYLKAEAASSINVAVDKFVDRSLRRR